MSVTVKGNNVTLDTIEQKVIMVKPEEKLDRLMAQLREDNPYLAIVFCNKKEGAIKLSYELTAAGFNIGELHGDLTQGRRTQILRDFARARTQILVATDIAARGIDIEGISHVYNYDVPHDVDYYIHRIGRTGRAGKAGMANTFVIPREMEHLHAIERLTKRKIARRKAPSLGEVLEGQQKLAVQSLINMADDTENLKEYRASAEELLNDLDSVTLVAAAIKLLTKEPDTTPVNITEEAPLRVRKKRSFGKDGRRRDGQRSSRSSDRRGDRRNGERSFRDRSGRDDSRRAGGNRSKRRNPEGQDRRGGQEAHKSGAFKPYFKD